MQVEISPQIAARLRAHLRAAGSREIGGVLMGEQIAPGHFRVVDFSIDDQGGSFAHFVRSPAHHAVALEAFFERTGADYQRFNYLGEWHSHPSFPVRPSVEDATSMMELISGDRGIDFAVLLIVKLRFFVSLEYSITIFSKSQLQPQAPGQS